MAPLLRQIESLRARGLQLDIVEVKGRARLKYLQTIPKVRKMVRDVDLVHAHYGYCGWIARMQLRKPVVVSFMGNDVLGSPPARGIKRLLVKIMVKVSLWLAPTFDDVIVKSPEMAEAIKPVQSHVIPNGVNMQAFRPMDREETREKLGWPAGKRYILFPGNPDDPRKGYALAKEVVAEVYKKTGETLELVPLRKVPHELVPLYMNACEAMLMASMLEGSPNVVKEAMACNLPTVSVPVGDVPDLLAGLKGYAVRPYEAKPLADALITILSEDHQQVEGRDAIMRKRLSLEDVAEKIHAIYDDVLAKKQK